MSTVIRFRTAKFDVSQERPNPINPIPGESLLWWLRERARPELGFSEPEAEDWGWYAEVAWQGRGYLLGATAYEEENGEREWLLQIEKHRAVTEKLSGRAKMTKDDACVNYFLGLLQGEAAFKDVAIDAEP